MCVESKKYNKLVTIQKKETDSQNELEVTRAAREEGKGNVRVRQGVRQAPDCIVRHGECGPTPPKQKNHEINGSSLVAQWVEDLALSL